MKNVAEQNVSIENTRQNRKRMFLIEFWFKKDFNYVKYNWKHEVTVMKKAIAFIVWQEQRDLWSFLVCIIRQKSLLKTKLFQSVTTCSCFSPF